MQYLWILFFPLLLSQQNPDSKKELYRKARMRLRQKQNMQAENLFKRLLPLLEAETLKQLAGSNSQHRLVLGQCDILYHLSSIYDSQKRYRASCLALQSIQIKVKNLPPNWQVLGVHPELPGRLQKAAQTFTNRCPLIPSLLKLKVFQNGVSVGFFDASGSYRAAIESGGVWKLETIQKVVRVKISAKGYQTLVKKIPLMPWSEKELAVQLKKIFLIALRRPRVVPIRRMEPKPIVATPIYKKWWFWTGVGVVVVGVGAGVFVATTADINEKFVGPNGEGFSLFSK